VFARHARFVATILLAAAAAAAPAESQSNTPAARAAVDPAAPVPVEAFAELPVLADPSLSPDGAHMAGTLGNRSLSPIKTVHYAARDGTPIEAVLTLPRRRSPKNLPLIDLPHGGPIARDSEGWNWWRNISRRPAMP